MSAPSTTPRLNLADALTPQTHQAVMRIAYEVGIQPNDIGDCRYLAWLIEVLKHIRDTPHNFPNGKFHTIQTLQRVVSETAGEVARIYYGKV